MRTIKAFVVVTVITVQAFAVGVGPARSAAAVAEYAFEGTLASSVASAPDLVAIGKGENAFVDEDVLGTTRTVLRFPMRNGLRLSPTTDLVDGESYTIELLFRLHEIEGWRKLVDFAGGSDDAGLYSFYGQLNLYPTALATPASILADTYALVVLTRDASGTVAGYVNGVQQFSFDDSERHAVIAEGDTLRFFRDDRLTMGLEASAGAVSRIRLYDAPLTELEVTALACAELPGVICGSDGDDHLTGTSGDDLILAGPGDDTIDGAGGNDTIAGQDGNDTIVTSDGADVLVGGDGDDTLTSGAGADVLSGQVGADTLTAGAGRDVLDGGDGPDRLSAEGGKDLCIGGRGKDEFEGCEFGSP